jgi:uncharacterized protein (DUF433 family)
MQLPDFLTQDPDGEIQMVGHRIGLYTVARRYREGWSAQQIADEYPSLPLELVQKVIDFYLQNRAEADAYVDAYEAELDRQYANYRPGPEHIRIRQLAEAIQQADEKYAADPHWANLCLREKVKRIEAENQNRIR